MAYSTATFQAVSILLYIHFKTEEGLYEYLSTRIISKMLDIPAPTAVKVLNRLNAAGITHTKEGSKGGILLSKSISDITIFEIFTAIEHEKPLFKIHCDFNFEPETIGAIKEKAISCLKDAEKAMKESLKRVTLSDLVE